MCENEMVVEMPSFFLSYTWKINQKYYSKNQIYKLH